MSLSALPPDTAQRLRDTRQAGLYACSEEDARAFFQAANGAGLNAWRIDLGLAGNARELHHTLAHALDFPDWFGENWDALADCLSDLSWHEADGHLLVLTRCEHLQEKDPGCYAALLDLLKDVVMAWQAQNLPFWVLLTGQHPELPPPPN